MIIPQNISLSPHQRLPLFSLKNEQDQRNIPNPTFSVSNVTHHRIHLILSIILKNNFSNIEIIKNPSKNSDIILPSVAVETKLLVFSCVIINGICPYNACWVFLGNKHMIFVITAMCSTHFNLYLLLGF